MPGQAQPISRHMQRAFQLARAALGTTSPNPAVGAVIVRDGQIVGEGATAPPGGPHAEAAALRLAGPRARGATLFTTLEPCAHHGRTPPCTDAIIEAGIASVAIAALDPDAQVDGRGLAQLRQANIQINLGDGAAQGAAHYEPYFHHRRTGLPFVAAKFAASLDGRIAAVSGDSRWISSPHTLAWAHRIRPTLDAILVGVQTILADNPQLTARPPGATGPIPQPLRIVLDSRGRTPPDARVLQDQTLAPTLIATTKAAPASWRAQITQRGAQPGVQLAVLPDHDGRVSLPHLLEHLGRERGIVLLLVEGGGEVLGSFLDQRLIDKIHAVIAPMLIGGDAQTAVRGRGAQRIADALRLSHPDIQQLGPDLLISGYPYAPADAEQVRLRPAGPDDADAIAALLNPADGREQTNALLTDARHGQAVLWVAARADDDAPLEGFAAALLNPSGAQLAALAVRRAAPPELADRLREAVEASAAGRGRPWITAPPLLPPDQLRKAGYRYFRKDPHGGDLFIKPLTNGEEPR